MRSKLAVAAAALGCVMLAGCGAVPAHPPAIVPAAATSAIAPASVVAPAVTGHEIIVAGQRFPAGTRVITWLEAGGYNAYRGRATFEPRQVPAREGGNIALGSRGSADLAALQDVVDQFVLHYDAEGLSRNCFEVLQRIGLSVHFLLDLDGTIYQTLDLQERAAHATIANSRSIGIEIANIGAYPPNESAPLAAWYRRDTSGATIITLPDDVRASGIYTGDFVGRPARPGPIHGAIHGKELVQYDFTPEQYVALAKLTAALCRVFPKIACDAPRDARGEVIRGKLPADAFARYRGILGHFHVQENKVDPGPAFQWERFLEETRQRGQ